MNKFTPNQTGSTKNYRYNNMFIWNTIEDTVSKKELFSPYKNIIKKLRSLYDKYIKEIALINNNNKIKKNIILLLDKTIRSTIVLTEVITNHLYYYNWQIKLINLAKDDFIISYSELLRKYISTDLLNNLNKLNKIENLKSNKLSKITSNIISEFEKLQNKNKSIIIS